MAYLLYPANGAIFHDRYLHQEGERAIAANNSRDRQPDQIRHKIPPQKLLDNPDDLLRRSSSKIRPYYIYL